jgi:hypothetical protein
MSRQISERVYNPGGTVLNGVGGGSPFLQARAPRGKGRMPLKPREND